MSLIVLAIDPPNCSRASFNPQSSYGLAILSHIYINEILDSEILWEFLNNCYIYSPQDKQKSVEESAFSVIFSFL